MNIQNTKRVVLALILILPSAIYIFLTTGKHNFIHLPFVGPQTDSTYHLIPDFAFLNQFGDTITQKIIEEIYMLLTLYLPLVQLFVL